MFQQHNVYLVVLSLIIAIISSYSALTITAKITVATSKLKIFWLISGSVVMGTGIWSMHFVGMIAHYSHASVTYDLNLTIISMVVSIGSSFIAFYLTLFKKMTMYQIGVGGFFMGSGIISMHYIGMKAIIMDGVMTFNNSLVITSIIIALLASYIALILFDRFKSQPRASLLKWLAALVMGLAVSGMHYIGMAATTMELFSTPAHKTYEIDLFLLIGVIIAISITILIVWTSIYFDRFMLEKIAYKDHVTGLANRNELTRFFRKIDPNNKISLLFIDLDHFKAINDTFGHDIGDFLLKHIGLTLKKFQNDFSQGFRIGGDEFVFILNHPDLSLAEKAAQSLLDELKEPFYVNGNELNITCSIGIANGFVEKNSYKNLLRAADTAMYVAKKNGKNQYSIFTTDMKVEVERKLKLEKDLSSALKSEQFFLEYQTKWNLKTNQLFGFEALVRWGHPEFGTIYPDEFMPLIEKTGMLITYSKWLLEQVCKHFYTLETLGIKHPVSVNLSAKLFLTDKLYDIIDKSLKKSGINPHDLEIEFTESMMLLDVDHIIQQLKKVGTLGIKVSMDEFGTGYSSIGLLDILPINTVKLDRQFSINIDKPSKQAIIRAIVILAESLGLEVIADGVEVAKDVNQLLELGCYIMQGSYFSQPIPFEEIKTWAKHYRR
ncbi:bifunctional diguanylate cyclase/phosphodiesterase [Amphibacillus xylanus]|uniref:Putative signaling protein n=1 Tax=Amphibacillus xylanus (strain ATCC 51415 / DSM 6626 / JCM 7361 / LMG 17667 / NBRC 15112 / Ep01) TaxID=698758 RepID=K0J4Y2_AMPXN|nr:EAL domain-containing protein [Amphibacillus xylanus]BAM48442.1 putative signaling protein [Amphibacillus xylanus NBRC 15112]